MQIVAHVWAQKAQHALPLAGLSELDVEFLLRFFVGGIVFPKCDCMSPWQAMATPFMPEVSSARHPLKMILRPVASFPQSPIV